MIPEVSSGPQDRDMSNGLNVGEAITQKLYHHLPIMIIYIPYIYIYTGMGYIINIWVIWIYGLYEYMGYITSKFIYGLYKDNFWNKLIGYSPKGTHMFPLIITEYIPIYIYIIDDPFSNHLANIRDLSSEYPIQLWWISTKNSHSAIE